MPCALSNIIENDGNDFNHIYNVLPNSRFQSINKCDSRFENILTLEGDVYSLNYGNEKLIVNCILDIKQKNSFLESFPFDYYLLVVSEEINKINEITSVEEKETIYSFLILKTNTKLTETPIYKDFKITNKINIYCKIEEFRLLIYKNIIIPYGYVDNIFYFTMCYMLFSKNLIIDDHLEDVCLDYTCNDIDKLTDYVSNRKNKYSNITMLPQQNNQISLLISFNNDSKKSDKEFNFIFKHDHSKFLKLELI